mmetsp:Transcript_15874/g.32622  ORF Transcript_15874/g.32622 Transcript_15874/m.32622 type:complete len:274 (-) Transcript_15874:8-829(-)
MNPLHATLLIAYSFVLTSALALASQVNNVNTSSKMSPPLDSKKRINKRITFVRHGRTHANEMLSKMKWGSPNFADPLHLRDSELNEVGRFQAGRELKENLKSISDGVEIVFVSPLTRTLDTLRLSCEDTSNLPVQKFAHPLLAERLYMIADVGTPKSQLESSYSPFVDFQLVEEEEWWWNESRMDDPDSYEEWRPNGENQSYSVKGEIPSAFKKRMMALYDFLDSRPENHILCVTSWGIIRALTKMDPANCEVVTTEMSQIKKSLESWNQENC